MHYEHNSHRHPLRSRRPIPLNNRPEAMSGCPNTPPPLRPAREQNVRLCLMLEERTGEQRDHDVRRSRDLSTPDSTSCAARRAAVLGDPNRSAPAASAPPARAVISAVSRRSARRGSRPDPPPVWLLIDGALDESAWRAQVLDPAIGPFTDYRLRDQSHADPRRPGKAPAQAARLPARIRAVEERLPPPLCIGGGPCRRFRPPLRRPPHPRTWYLRKQLDQSSPSTDSNKGAEHKAAPTHTAAAADRRRPIPSCSRNDSPSERVRRRLEEEHRP